MSMESIVVDYTRADVLLIAKGRGPRLARLLFHPTFLLAWYGFLWFIHGDNVLKPSDPVDWMFLLMPVGMILPAISLLRVVLLGDSYRFDRTADVISRNGKRLGSFASLHSVQVRERRLTGKNRLSFILESDEWIIDSEGADSFGEYLRAGTELAKLANVELARYDPSQAGAAANASRPRERPYDETPLLVAVGLLMGSLFLL